MAGKRTLGDWIWTLVGIGGLACIGIAIWMFFGGRAGPTPEEAAQARAAQAKEHLEKGRALLEEGKGEEAVKEIQTAIGLGEEPRQPSLDVVYDLGRALKLAGQDKEALQLFHAVLAQRPLWFDPHLRIARVLDGNEQAGGAWQYYRAAWALHPDPVPEELTKRAEELGAVVREKRAEEIGRVRSEFRANPANVDAFSLLVLAALQDVKVAFDAPPDAGLRAAIAAAGAGIEDLPALVAAQESAVSDRPKSVVDRAGLGNLVLLAGDAKRAKEIFTQATELSESDAAARLGEVVAGLLAGEDLPEARAKRLPANPLALLAFAAARLEKPGPGNVRAALAVVRQQDPALPEVYRLLAKALDGAEEQAQRDLAKRAFERLTE